MAQTWRITRTKVALFRAFDAVGGIFRRSRNRSPLDPQEIERILVLEPWHIGDVVLATPVLRVLRHRLPGARITVLGKRHAEELLRHSGLADEVIVFDLPWTAKQAKYDPRRYDWTQLRDLVAHLRRRKFDLTIDARMDARSNLLTLMTRASRRIGYDFGGAAFLLTDALAADPDRHHRVNDWLSLILPFFGDAPHHETGSDADTRYVDTRYAPLLAVSDTESENAVATLRASGIVAGDVVVALHGGASDPRRMWPAERFERVARALVDRHGVKCVFFLEPDAPERDIPAASAVLRTSLREMMAILAQCDLFICNDSGPMHIADALDVPVVGVFLTGNPVWHRPYRPGQSVVGRGTGHDVLVAPTEEGVLAAAETQLSRRGVTDRRRKAATGAKT